MQRVNELESDIEATRARLDLTLDALQRHASWTSLADDALGYLSETGASKQGERLLQVARENPLPVALAAVGVGWFLKRLFAGTGTPLPTTAHSRQARGTGNGFARAPAHAVADDNSLGDGDGLAREELAEREFRRHVERLEAERR